MENCRECNVRLTDENWWPSWAARNNRLCIPCCNEAAPVKKKRHDAIRALGSMCEYCGFYEDIHVLQIDHIAGNAFEARKVDKNHQYKVYKEILAGNITDYRVLCAGCNAMWTATGYNEGFMIFWLQKRPIAVEVKEGHEPIFDPIWLTHKRRKSR